MAGYIGSKAVSVNTTSATISDDLAVGDDATIAGTALVTGVLTTTAATVFNGGFASNANSSLSNGLAIGQTSFTGGNTLLDIHGSGSGVGANMAFANDHNTDKFFVGIAGDTTGDALIYNAEDSDLIFGTNNAVRMTVTSAGKLGLGTDAPQGTFVVQASNAKSGVDNDGSKHLEMGIGSGGCSFMMTTGHTMAFGHQPYANRGSDTNFTNRMTIEAAGDVTIEDGNLVIGTAGHGIDFSAQTATATGSTSSELFDHYEEGTFTITLAPSAGFTASSNTVAGNYTKIGRQVTVTGIAQMTTPASLGSYSNNSTDFGLSLSGLPFTIPSTISFRSAPVIGVAVGLGTNDGVLVGHGDSNNTSFSIYQNKDSGGIRTSPTLATSTAATLHFSFTYFA